MPSPLVEGDVSHTSSVHRCLRKPEPARAALQQLRALVGSGEWRWQRQLERALSLRNLWGCMREHQPSRRTRTAPHGPTGCQPDHRKGSVKLIVLVSSSTKTPSNGILSQASAARCDPSRVGVTAVCEMECSADTVSTSLNTHRGRGRYSVDAVGRVRVRCTAFSAGTMPRRNALLAKRRPFNLGP